MNQRHASLFKWRVPKNYNDYLLKIIIFIILHLKNVNVQDKQLYQEMRQAIERKMIGNRYLILGYLFFGDMKEMLDINL